MSKKVVPKFLVKKRMSFINSNLLETKIKTKKIHCILEFNQSQWLKPYNEFNTQKRIKTEKKKIKRSKSVVQINE